MNTLHSIQSEVGRTTSVGEALYLIEDSCSVRDVIVAPLMDVVGCVLANDVYSPSDSPPFDQSAMDGYAFRYSDMLQGELHIRGEVQAGSAYQGLLPVGSTARVFTGAPIPDGADTVAMQEHTYTEGDRLFITNSSIALGDNVRPLASQIARDQPALARGTKLSPGAVGYLTSLGVTEVTVFPAPRVGIIVTGKELAYPGSELQPGQVYECNSATLTAALFEGRLEPVFTFMVDDELEELETTIERCLEACDILLITGGVSVGDFDLVPRALQSCGVVEYFHKVKQKPGKPIYFGKNGDCCVFGLPGNPASVLTCFYEYVVPAIRGMSGMRFSPWLDSPKMLTIDVKKKAGLTTFLRGKTSGDVVVPLPNQESYKLSSFADADCLIILDEECDGACSSEQVRVHRFADAWY